MSRDWQKDMLINLMQRTERAKADGTIEYVAIDFNALTALIEGAAAEKERGDKAEEREKVLKHAFIVMLGYVPKTARVALDFDEVLASLYPKEETKP